MGAGSGWWEAAGTAQAHIGTASAAAAAWGECAGEHSNILPLTCIGATCCHWSPSGLQRRRGASRNMQGGRQASVLGEGKGAVAPSPPPAGCCSPPHGGHHHTCQPPRPKPRPTLTHPQAGVADQPGHLGLHFALGQRHILHSPARGPHHRLDVGGPLRVGSCVFLGGLHGPLVAPLVGHRVKPAVVIVAVVRKGKGGRRGKEGEGGGADARMANAWAPTPPSRLLLLAALHREHTITCCLPSSLPHFSLLALLGHDQRHVPGRGHGIVEEVGQVGGGVGVNALQACKLDP